MALRIEDYALIGDTHTAALVGIDGSIDWLCLPRFDSPACFAALLGTEQNGHWRIAPTGELTAVRRRYRGDTLVLETEFETDTGVIRLVDCMPVRDGHADLVRLVEGVSGEVEVRMEWVLRFSYGSATPWVRRIEDEDGRTGVLAIAGPDAVCLRGDVLPRATQGDEDRAHRAEFTVRAGDSMAFSMMWFPSHEDVPHWHDVQQVVDDTQRWWAEWAAQCCYSGDYHEAVLRSLITLKALTYQPTGGIVAAVTTSLPEQFGGVRNWDYRYCWLRDATLTLYSLLNAGYVSEARDWRGWLIRAIAGDPEDLQIVYGCAGERHLLEYELDWLPGYEGAKPVRVGNGAARQFQLDVYGEVMAAMAEAREAGLEEDRFSWSLQRALMSFVEDNWQRPDSGLWEVRGPERRFTHSRVMAWVAFDRAVKACETYGLEGPVERWRTLREAVRDEVLTEAWNESKQAYTQYYGGTDLDASLLVMPLVGFLPAHDERMLSTVDAIERELRRGDAVYRYTSVTPEEEATEHAVDGLPPGENPFLACSFWLVDNYARCGRVDEAHQMMRRLLALRNDVGLLAEEYDPDQRRMAGNFPQAFSHLALVDAAMSIAGSGAQRHASQGARHVPAPG